MTQDTAQRFNTGKSRVDLIPPDALMELGKLYARGAEKYAPRNWELGMPWSDMLASLKRHLYLFEMGENVDAESGEFHANHVAWNALGLLAYVLRGIGKDDRHVLSESVRIYAQDPGAHQ